MHLCSKGQLSCRWATRKKWRNLSHTARDTAFLFVLFAQISSQQRDSLFASSSSPSSRRTASKGRVQSFFSSSSSWPSHPMSASSSPTSTISPLLTSSSNLSILFLSQYHPHFLSAWPSESYTLCKDSIKRRSSAFHKIRSSLVASSSSHVSIRLALLLKTIWIFTVSSHPTMVNSIHKW